MTTVIVFKDRGQLVAQCLEYDICVMALDLVTLQSRFEAAFAAENLDSLPKAPDVFLKIGEWNDNRTRSE